MNATDLSARLAMAVRLQRPFVMGIIGSSGSGKTTLLEELVAHLRCNGLAVSAIKRAHDGFDLDQPGKDSFRLREAGCGEIMLVSDRRWALLHESLETVEPNVDDLLRKMTPVDIVLVEGFRNLDVPSIEVFRPSHGRLPHWPDNRSVIAVATDEPLVCSRLVLDLARGDLIAEFVLQAAFSRVTECKCRELQEATER